MNLLDKLERKLGRNFGIKGLMTYIIGLNAVVFFLSLMDQSGRFVNMLTLDPDLVRKGEVWRLVTYAFIPPSFSILFFVFVLYFYYLIGSSLEHEWGTFKFNAYYLIGMIGTTIAAFLTGGGATSTYLNLSLFLAFAYIFPNYQILLFFIIPIKIKYLAWLDVALIVFTVITGNLTAKVVALVSILNFLVFFGRDIIISIRQGRRSFYNRRRFEVKKTRDPILHKCEVCGRTERDSKDLEFRYCVDCEGDHEYCMEHLGSHKHVGK